MDGSRPRPLSALRWMLAAALLAAAVLSHAPAFAQAYASVTLQVTDGETGEPLPGAIIRLDGVVRAVSDTTGYVLLDGLEPGRHQLDVAMLGRRTVSPEIEVVSGQVLNLEVVLDPEAVDVPPVVVVGTPDGAAGVRGNRGRGGGRYFSREQIARMRIRRLSQLLVRINALQPNGRGRQAQCVPRVVADGIMLGETSLDIFPVQDVEAVVVFSNGDMPPEFGGTSAGVCGLVAVWTRHK